MPAMQDTWVQTLSLEDPLEKEMAMHSRTIAWKIPWTEVRDIVQETGIKIISKKKKCKKTKWLSEGGLTNSCEKKRSEKQSRRGKIFPFGCGVPKSSKER